MLWFTRAASWAAVINVLATALGFYVPALTAGLARAAALIVALIVVAIAAINIRGIRQSSVVLNLAHRSASWPRWSSFIAVGLFFVDGVAARAARHPVAGRVLRDGPAPHLCVRRLRGGPRARGRGEGSRARPCRSPSS